MDVAGIVDNLYLLVELRERIFGCSKSPWTISACPATPASLKSKIPIMPGYLSNVHANANANVHDQIGQSLGHTIRQWGGAKLA